MCNGSYMPHKAQDLGTACWVLEDSSKVIRAEDFATGSCVGVVRTSGTSHEVNTYRSKLQGIHTLLLAIKAICIQHSIFEGSI